MSKITYHDILSHSPIAKLQRRWFMMILFTMLAIMSYAFSAQAQVFGSVNSNFACAISGGGNQLLNSGSICPSNFEDGKIFSYFICQTEKLISEVFGQFYCQLQNRLIDPMTAVITLAIVLFGIAFMIGVVPATAKDSMLFLFKVSVVWGFATQAELMIGVGYKFFMGGLQDGIAIVVKSIFTPSGAAGAFTPSGVGGQQIYSYMDDIFKHLISVSTESVGKDSSAPGADNFCKNAVFGALVLLMIAFPPLFFMGIFLLFKFIMFFLRAVLGYIFAVMGISFLICLAPIFLSFYFWQSTQQYFTKWIAHLAGFAIQMVIIFAFISFILSMNVSSISKELMDLIVPYDKSVEAPGIRWPWKVCTICDFEVVEKGTTGGLSTEVPTSGVRCKDTPGKPLNPGSLAGIPVTDEAGGGTVTGEMKDTIMKLAVKVVLTLLVLAYVINAMLDIVPQLAARLAASVGSQPIQLVGGGNKLPGEEALEKTGQAFAQNLSSGQSVTAASDAFLKASQDGLNAWLKNPIN